VAVRLGQHARPSIRSAKGPIPFRYVSRRSVYAFPDNSLSVSTGTPKASRSRLSCSTCKPWRSAKFGIASPVQTRAPGPAAAVVLIKLPRQMEKRSGFTPPRQWLRSGAGSAPSSAGMIRRPAHHVRAPVFMRYRHQVGVPANGHQQEIGSSIGGRRNGPAFVQSCTEGLLKRLFRISTRPSYTRQTPTSSSWCRR